MASRFFRIPIGEIAYMRAVLEAYDGVAFVHAPDPRRGEIEWVIGEGLDDEAAELAERLARETGMVEIARPNDWTRS